MHGFMGFWKGLATPRSATAGTTQGWLASEVEPNTNEAQFGEQLRRLHQSLEEANERARLKAKWGDGYQRARAVGSGVVRPV
jgi:hypothetical protein